MRKKKSWWMIGVCFLLVVVWFIRSNQLRAVYVDDSNEGESAIKYEEQLYYPVLNADHFDYHRKVGKLSAYDTLYTIKGYPEEDYLAAKGKVIMETLEKLYVSETAQRLPIEFFDQLSTSEETIGFKGKSYTAYLKEEDQILSQTEKVSETDVYDIYGFKDFSTDEWLLVHDKNSKTLYSYCADFDQLTSIPAAIYQFEKQTKMIPLS
ncbi:hypothetical protein [Enterococcus olivae]